MIRVFQFVRFSVWLVGCFFIYFIIEVNSNDTKPYKEVKLIQI